jgi:hypothetical protein
MNNLIEIVQRYLGELRGDRLLHMKEWSVAALPLHLRERYRLFRTDLFGREWVLALEGEGWEAGTPSEYRNQAQQIEHAAGIPVVLVLPSIPATVRNRMVQMNIAFLVPGTQVFVPLYIINLQERYGDSLQKRKKPLGPTAQVMVLYQIRRGGLEVLSSKQIAKTLGYSEMAIVKARAELETHRLCASRRYGKEVRLECDLPSRQLWERALPLLRTPVVKRHWCHVMKPLPSAKVAGISALASRGNLADEPIPTHAMEKKIFQKRLEQDVIHGCPHREDANIRVETWTYAPALLTDKPAVDPLSLFLSLRDDPDERVQTELTVMMEGLSWR